MVGGGLGDETILDRRDGDAALEHFGEHRGETAETSAALPTAAVDEEEQRRGGGGLGFPEMDELLRMRAVGDVEVRGVGQRRGGEFALCFVGRDVAHIDGAPANLAAVRLEHERPACGERFSFLPEIFHRRALDDEAGVERDPHACTDLADTHGVPLAERFVGGHDRIAAEGLGSVVEESTGAEVRTAVGFLRIEDLVKVPNLHLWITTEVNAAVGFRDSLVFDEQFVVAERFVGGGVRAGAGVDELALLDAPVRGELGAHLGELGVAFFAREFGGVVGVEAVPAGEILAVEERAETRGWLGLGGAERGERGDGCEGEDEPRDESQRGGRRGNGEVHGV